jgi:Fic family protein
MDELLASIAAKKERLDKLRPLSGKALAALEHYQDVELTFTSNAIEGNTLTRVETSIVIEKGITVSSKPLKDHLEAVDHYNALRYVRELARQDTALTEGDVRNLHKLVVQRSDPDIAGRYADSVRYTPPARGGSALDVRLWRVAENSAQHARGCVHGAPPPGQYSPFQ